MSLKDELEKIIAQEQAELAEEGLEGRSRGEDSPRLLAPLVAAFRGLKASMERRPRA